MSTAPVYGLLGQSLKHSYSVPVHQAFGCPDYRLIEIAPETLADFFAQTRIGGLNVTIPYKRAVMAYCDTLSAEAQAIGSVNTIVQAANGQRIGYNTDVFGLRHTAERAGIDWHQKKVLVFGSGGAALTAQAVARTQGARAAVLISRHGPETYAHLERHADAEVLINATPVGMYPQVGVLPADPADRLRKFKATLLDEVNEIDDIDAACERNAEPIDVMVAIADLLGDVIVYCRSEALKFGLPLEDVLAVIMDSNESKLGADGKPIYDANGKFLKGPNYWKPEPKIKELLQAAIAGAKD